MKVTLRFSLLASALLMGACSDSSPVSGDADQGPAIQGGGDALPTDGPLSPMLPTDSPALLDPDTPDTGDEPDPSDSPAPLEPSAGENDSDANGGTDQGPSLIPAADPNTSENPLADPVQPDEQPAPETPADESLEIDEEPKTAPPPAIEPPAEPEQEPEPEQEQEAEPEADPESAPSEPSEPNPVEPVMDPQPDTPPPSDTPDDPSAQNPSTNPSIPGRAEAERIFAALTRMVATTVLDLNASLASGMPLSDAQTACLGAFDPAMGQTLFAIDCPQPLAVDTIDFAVGLGALEPTDRCGASLMAGSVEDCMLSAGSATVRTHFKIVPEARLPLPASGSGVIVRYNVEPGVLEVLREPGAPLADFRCGFVVATGATLPSNRGDCDGALRDTANYLDSLFAPS